MRRLIEAAERKLKNISKARQAMRTWKDNAMVMAYVFDSQIDEEKPGQFYVLLGGNLEQMAKVLDEMGNRKLGQKLRKLSDEAEGYAAK